MHDVGKIVAQHAGGTPQACKPPKTSLALEFQKGDPQLFLGNLEKQMVCNLVTQFKFRGIRNYDAQYRIVEVWCSKHL